MLAGSAATGQRGWVLHTRDKPAGPWWLRGTADLLHQAVKFEGKQDIGQPLCCDAAKPQIPQFIRKIVGVV